MDYTVYLVEDDENLNLVLKSYLEKEGWKVVSFSNGMDAYNAISDTPHLWILDIMLPDMDGYSLIKKIKELDKNTPVIFISARDQDVDRLVGLELGSDDYMPKPFLPRELVIRVSNLLKRVYPEVEDSAISIADYTISVLKRTVVCNDEEIDLSSREFDLLVYFINNKDIALSREQILDEIWGEEYFGSDRVVDDLVRRLRKKMPNLKLETIYGYGYRMEIL